MSLYMTLILIYTDSIMNFPLQRQKNRQITQSIGGDDGKFKIKAV